MRLHQVPRRQRHQHPSMRTSRACPSTFAMCSRSRYGSTKRSTCHSVPTIHTRSLEATKVGLPILVNCAENPRRSGRLRTTPTLAWKSRNPRLSRDILEPSPEKYNIGITFAPWEGVHFSDASHRGDYEFRRQFCLVGGHVSGQAIYDNCEHYACCVQTTGGP
jgi:hypothetical protein